MLPSGLPSKPILLTSMSSDTVACSSSFTACTSPLSIPVTTGMKGMTRDSSPRLKLAIDRVMSCRAVSFGVLYRFSDVPSSASRFMFAFMWFVLSIDTKLSALTLNLR